MPPGSGDGEVLSSLRAHPAEVPQRPGLVLWTRTQSCLFGHLSQPVLSALVSQPRPRPTLRCVLLSASAVPSTQMPDLSLPWASGPAPGPTLGPSSFALFCCHWHQVWGEFVCVSICECVCVCVWQVVSVVNACLSQGAHTTRTDISSSVIGTCFYSQ